MLDTLLDSDSFWILPFGAFLGAFGLVIGLWLRNRTKRFVQAAVETTGTYLVVVTDSGEKPYRAVRFETIEGKVIRYRPTITLPWNRRTTGGEITVLYDPIRPEVARLNSFVELMLPWLIFLLVGGAVLLLVGGVVLTTLFFNN